VESLQRELVTAKFDTKAVDGFYGNNTRLAVQAFQNANAPLESTGIVEDATWQKLMRSPIPPIDVRTLELTAAFEGHGYTLAEGNWDRAWLTWGIIGFTMIHQEVQKIVLAVETSAPTLIRTAFGDNAGKLLEVMNDTPRNQEQWANSISNGSRVVEPWLTGFRLLGQFPQVQQIQSGRTRSLLHTGNSYGAEIQTRIRARSRALLRHPRTKWRYRRGRSVGHRRYRDGDATCG
jgi:hypothetical protein